METAKFKVGDILVDKKTSTRYRIIFVSGRRSLCVRTAKSVWHVKS